MSDQEESSTTTMRNEFLVDQMVALLEQEGRYQCLDYMSPEYREKQIEQIVRTPLQFVAECAAIVTDLPLQKSSSILFHPSPTDVRNPEAIRPSHTDSPPVPRSSDMDHLSPWRSQMCSWAYTAVDTFGHDRSVVAVAFNYLDRYIATGFLSHVKITSQHFQLLTMTCVYMAVKIMGLSPKKLSIHSMMDMSRGFFSAHDFEETELDILDALDWRLNPPTPSLLCNLLLEFIEDGFELRESCRQRCEEAVMDNFYVSQMPSDIAFSAVLLSARQHGYLESTLQSFCQEMADYTVTSSINFMNVYLHMEMP